MRKLILIMLILCLPSMALAQAWQVSDAGVKGLNTPVDIAYDGEFLYISNQGQNGKGFVAVNDAPTSVKVILKDQLRQPAGIAASRGRLLVIDLNYKGDGVPHLVLADLKTDKILDVLALPDAINPNTVTAVNSSTFVVSDSDQNEIFQVTLDNNKLAAEDLVNNINQARGVGLQGGMLYIGGMALDEKTQTQPSGSIYQVDPYTSATQRYITYAHTDMSRINALTIKDNYLFFSNWVQGDGETGTIYVLNTMTKRRIGSIRNVPGPEALCFAGETLYVASPEHNKIIKIEIDWDALRDMGSN